jgi:hypothetical protein
MCPIDWCGFTWEAFATLAAGGAAVGGATLIGLRQLRVTAQQAEIADRQATVMSRQADILEHQVQVDRAKLRADLFDRRLAVFKACKAYIRDAMTIRVDFEPTPAVWRELADQLEQAEFLFAGDVRSRLREAAGFADTLLTEREMLRELRGTDSAPEINQQGEKVRMLNAALRLQLANLAEAMGEEMKLYIPRASDV